MAYEPIRVIAFERKNSYVFNSIGDAATAYDTTKKTIINRINDGGTLKDGYTTVDYLFELSEDPPLTLQS